MTLREAYEQTLAENRYLTVADFWRRVGVKAGMGAVKARRTAEQEGLPMLPVGKPKSIMPYQKDPPKHHRFCRR